MQIALTLQYIPTDGVSAPVPVHTTTDPAVLRSFRRAILRAEATIGASPDPLVAWLLESEARHLRAVLDRLIPEQSS